MNAYPLDSSNPMVDEWIMKYSEPFLAVSSASSATTNQTPMGGSANHDENSSSSLTFQDIGAGGSGRGGSSTPNHFPLPPLAGPFSSGFSSSFGSQAGPSFDQYDCLLPPLEPSLDFENIMDLGTL